MFNIITFHLFIDIKSAYDNIERHTLVKVMEVLGNPAKLKTDKSNIENYKMRSKISE
jgi:hypothetical protein